jgi:putative transcriptional regulator
MRKNLSGLLDTEEIFCYYSVRLALHYDEGESMKNKVKELRDTLELTQKELGEIVGVSRQAINAIETGKFDPSIWLAYDLARYFGVSIETLFIFGEEDRK